MTDDSLHLPSAASGGSHAMTGKDPAKSPFFEVESPDQGLDKSTNTFTTEKNTNEYYSFFSQKIVR